MSRVRFNRQLSPDERQWASDRAASFAKRYEEETGRSLTIEQAGDMLLGTGYRMVDAVASKGPGGDPIAAAYISEHGGDMFRATPGEYKDLFLYGNKDGSFTQEQQALPGAVPNPKAGVAIAAGLATGGLAPGIVRGLALVPGAPILSTNGVLGAKALASPVGTGAISATINAGAQYLQNGKISPVDVGGAFVTGAAGSYGGLLWNVGVNTLGGATATAVNNILLQKDDSILFGGLAAGATSTLGYGLGKGMRTAIDAGSRPSINSSGWAASGQWAGQAGWNMLGPNNLPTIGSSVGAGFGTEFGGSVKNSLQESNK